MTSSVLYQKSRHIRWRPLRITVLVLKKRRQLLAAFIIKYSPGSKFIVAFHAVLHARHNVEHDPIHSNVNVSGSRQQLGQISVMSFRNPPYNVGRCGYDL